MERCIFRPRAIMLGAAHRSRVASSAVGDRPRHPCYPGGEVHMFGLRRIGGVGLLLALCTVMVACGGSTTSSSSAPAEGPSGITPPSFDRTFTTMPKFKPLASAGKGMVGVLLPDTASSARWADFAFPYLTTA